MKKIPYSALDSQGRSKSGYIEAESNETALAELLTGGFSNIEFYDDSSFGLPREDLDQLRGAELDAMARLEVSLRRNPGFGGFLRSVITANKWILLGSCGLLVWGVVEASILLVATGVVAGITLPAIAIWNYRVVNRYNDLLVAYAEGEWIRARRLINDLRRHSVNQEMAFDLDIKEVCANAENLTVEQAVSALEKWRDPLNEVLPGYYETRLASVYHHYGHYDTYLELLRQAHAEMARSPILVLDLALAEARLGNTGAAGPLLDNLNPEVLPAHAVPFVAWTRAAICRDEAGSAAGEHYQLAIHEFSKLNDGPALWPALALCVGDYAVYAAQRDSKIKVEKLLATVWPVLRSHGEDSMLEKLKHSYSGLS